MFPPIIRQAEFATALRAVGEPMRGKPVSELSVGQMLEGLFAITRDFDMQTQPHLLLLQKTMVMVEGLATQLNPEINMWDVSGPFVKNWIATNLVRKQRLPTGCGRCRGAAAPAGIAAPDRRPFPTKGGAPEQAPLPEVPLLWRQREGRGWGGYLIAGLAGAGLGVSGKCAGWLP